MCSRRTSWDVVMLKENCAAVRAWEEGAATIAASPLGTVWEGVP